MDQSIQVPQTVPNAPQFQPPTDLINAYLNRRQQDQQFAVGQVNKLGETVNALRQQKIQNQLAALGAVSQLYAAGGPRAVTQYAPALNQTAGTTLIPTQQTSIPPQGTPQNATLSNVQDQMPSPYIQASLAAGHPDVAGVGGFHAPQPTPSDLQDIQSGGTYGRNKAQSYKDLGDLSMQPITAQQKLNEIAMQPTEAALKKQQLVNAQAEIPMKEKATVAQEVSKQGENTTRIGQLRGLYNDLLSAVAANKPSMTSGLSGELATLSGGKFGNISAADLQNVSAPMTAALNYELTKRFNEGEAKFLMDSMMPKPKDQPAFAQKKLARLNHMISALESGNDQNIKNVASTISTGAIPSTTGAKSTPITSKAQYDALPNGASYTWYGKPHIKGKS